MAVGSTCTHNASIFSVFFDMFLRRVERIDTPAHKGLVHADFSGRLSVLVVKESAGFSFRNPGGLRVPAQQALQGGVSDCRNRTMQQMFLVIGLGERAVQTGMSLRTIERRIGGLKARHLRRVGSDKTGHWEVLEP